MVGKIFTAKIHIGRSIASARGGYDSLFGPSCFHDSITQTELARRSWGAKGTDVLEVITFPSVRVLWRWQPVVRWLGGNPG